MNRNRPTGVLVGRISIGGIDKKLKAFAKVSSLVRVHGDETEPARLLVSKVVAMFLGSHLGIADGIQDNSSLGCQITIDESMDGLVVNLPEGQH